MKTQYLDIPATEVKEMLTVAMLIYEFGNNIKEMNVAQAKDVIEKVDHHKIKNHDNNLKMHFNPQDCNELFSIQYQKLSKSKKDALGYILTHAPQGKIAAFIDDSTTGNNRPLRT
jgi:hypothetical protein